MDNFPKVYFLLKNMKCTSQISPLNSRLLVEKYTSTEFHKVLLTPLNSRLLVEKYTSVDGKFFQFVYKKYFLYLYNFSEIW